MMVKKLLVLFFSILIISDAAVFAQWKYKTYRNARFGYSISYPSDLLRAEGEADNGDGQTFAGEAGAEMRVFGSNQLSGGTLQREYYGVIKERGSVSYKVFRKNYFVVSGSVGDKIFYQKTIARPNGSFVTFMIEYDEAQRGVFDKVVAQIVKSFK